MRYFLLFTAVIFAAFSLRGATMLAPDFGAGKLDYIQQNGKKVYADLRDGKAVFKKGALELNGQELAYDTEGVLNLNNGTLSFDIEPLNFDGKTWKPGENRYITLFAAATDSGYTQLWLYLYPHNKSIGFFSWDNNRATVQARGSLLKVPGAFDRNKKTRVTATWDPQFIRLFINGVEVANASYGLGSDRVASQDMLIRFMPRNYQGKKLHNYRCRLSSLYLLDTTKTPGSIQAEFTAGKMDSSKILTLSELVAPKLVKTPVIDGKASTGEWDDAAMVPLQKQNAKSQLDSSIAATVKVKHDFKKLYCLFDVPGEKKPQLSAPADTFGSDVYSDSLVEVYLRKRNSARNDYYQFTVSPRNAHSVMTPGAKIKNIPFEHKAALLKNRYQVEIAIPLKNINMQDLKELEVNFGLHLPENEQLSLLDRWIAWSGIKRAAFALQCGKLTLADSNTVSRLQPFRGLNYGKVELSHSSNVPASAELTLRNGVGKVMLSKKFADARKLAAAFPLKWIGGGFLDFKVTDSKGRVLNSTSGKLLIQEPFSITYRTLPSAGKIEFDIDANGLGKSAAGKLFFTGILKDANKVLSQCKSRLTSLRSVAEMKLPALRPGKYKVQLSLSDGRNNYVKMLDFERPDDTFIKKALGRERTIPAPWGKMTFKDNKIKGSYFSYTFDKNSPFPVLAEKMGKKILNSGNLELIVNGKKQQFLHKNVKIVENAPDRSIVTGELQCRTAPLKVVYKRIASYDGLLKYHLTLVPAHPVTVNRFAWQGKIMPEMAKYGINPDVSPSFLKDYSTLDKVVHRTFPVAWVTGLKYGFTLFSDNDANWVGDSRYALVMDKTPERTLLTAEMIGKNVTVKRNIPYVLAMMSTPGKPPRSDWRQVYCHVPDKPGTGGTYYRSIGWGHERLMFRWYRWICLTHLWNPSAAAKRVAYFKQRGALSIPYCCGALMPDSNPIYNYYGHEWRRSFQGRLQPACEQGTDLDGVMFNGGIPICANNTGFADYMTYYTDQYLKKYDLYGIYLDFAGVYKTDKPFYDTDLTEYLTPGRKVSAWNIFGLRELYERLRKVLQKHGKDKVLWLHEWDRYHPAYASFGDLIYPGEEFMHKIRVNRRVYGEETPLEQWQVAYNSEVNGAAVQFLTQYRYFREPIHNLKKSEAEKLDFARDLMTMVLLHDVNMSDVFTKSWHALWDKLEIKKAQFYGYYTAPAVKVTTDNAAVKTAMYIWKGKSKAVLILGNTTNRPQKFKIKAANLVLSDKAYDLFNKKTVDLKKTFTFRDFDFLVLEVEIKGKTVKK